MSVVRLLFFFTFIACDKTNPPDFLRGRDEIKRLTVKSDSPLKIEFESLGDSDSYVDTMTKLSAKLSLKSSLTEKSFTIETQRIAIIPSSIDLSSADRKALSNVCRDISLVDAAGNSREKVFVDAGDLINIGWRSHYSEKDKAVMTKLAIENGDVPRCLLRLDVKTDNTQDLLLDLVFSPATAEQDFLISSKFQDKAIEEALLLLSLEESGYIIDTNSGTILSPSANADITLGVKAINQDSVSITSSGFGSCKTKSADSLEADQPNLEVNLTFQLESEVPFRIADLVSASSNGRILEQCRKMIPTVDENAIYVKTTCGNLLEVVNLAADEMCAFTAYLENASDEQNMIGKRIRIERYVLESEDESSSDVNVSNPRDAYAAIPKSTYNPIPNNQVVMNGFSQPQIAAAEVSFDLWLAHSEDTYNRFFANKINEIVYMDNRGPGCSTFSRAAAYAYLGDDRFYWCRAGYMNAAAIDPSQQAPAGAVYRALLMLHEVLHANNYYHDFDESRYRSCEEGTSLSAVIPVEVVTCNKSYCQQFKDFAIRDYVEELNYSVTDERRFQAKCAEWNNKLGLTRSSF